MKKSIKYLVAFVGVIGFIVIWSQSNVWFVVGVLLFVWANNLLIQNK